MEQTLLTIWLTIIVVCGILEAFTMNIVTAWFVVGGIAAVIANMTGGSSWVQSILFVTVSVLCIVLLRPLAIKIMINKNPEKFNKDALINKEAIVTTTIPSGNNTGEIKLDGKFWRANSVNKEEISVDTEVIVISINGVTLTVKAK